MNPLRPVQPFEGANQCFIKNNHFPTFFRETLFELANPLSQPGLFRVAPWPGGSSNWSLGRSGDRGAQAGRVIWVAGRRELVSHKLTHFYWFHQLKSGFDRLSSSGNWFDNGYQVFSKWASMKPPSNFHEWTMAACAGGTSFGFRTALSHHVLRTKRGGLKRRPCFFLKMHHQKRRVLGVLYFFANSWRFWEERWTLTMKAVRRNVNKLQDWQEWLLQLRQFHKVSSCPVRFYVALSCDLQKGCFGSRQPYCASCPSKLAFKRLDLQLVPEVFLVENLEVEICLQTPLWHSDLGFLIAVTIQGKSHLPGCILSILAEIPKPYDGQKFSIVLVVVSFCLGFFRFFLGVAGQYYPY